MTTYLDAAAGAPLHPVARAALLAALEDGWADPARLYRAGRQARLLLDATRESVAESIGVRVSLHHASTAAEVDAFLAVLPEVVAGGRAELGATGL